MLMCPIYVLVIYAGSVVVSGSMLVVLLWCFKAESRIHRLHTLAQNSPSFAIAAWYIQVGTMPQHGVVCPGTVQSDPKTHKSNSGIRKSGPHKAPTEGSLTHMSPQIRIHVFRASQIMKVEVQSTQIPEQTPMQK